MKIKCLTNSSLDLPKEILDKHQFGPSLSLTVGKEYTVYAVSE
jgi:fatty acid-binding protein DegV